MAGFDENIVREYFELNGFFVRQLRKYAVPSRRKQPEEEFDLAVVKPLGKVALQPPGFQLFSADLERIHRAIVVVCGWHTSRFSPSMLKSGRKIFDFLKQDVAQNAQKVFEFPEDDVDTTDDAFKPGYLRILVIPSLPMSDPHRSESISMLRDLGVDHILSFSTILENLVRQVEINRSYQKSDLLQLLRILKIYDMVKDPQLELFG